MRANTIQALAAALRGRRVALGWSQADTAAVAGISRKFVSEVEAGKETVELGKVLSLADAMGVDINITFAVGEDGIPVHPDVLRVAADRTPRPSSADEPVAPPRSTRRSTPPPPTETGSLEDLLDDYLRGDDT